MSLTYLDLQNRIASDLTRSDLTSQIKSAIGDAVKHYETSRFWWNVTRSLTFQTVANQQGYGTAALPQIPNIIKLDHLFLSSNPGSIYDLDFYEMDEFEWLAAANTSPGKPTIYTRADGQILLWPIPITAYTMRPHMHYRLDALVNDTDTNAWCNEAEQLIRCHAKLLLYTNVLEDSDGAQRMQSEIDAFKSRLDYENSARTATGRIKGTDF
jgi:hypothetical protein